MIMADFVKGTDTIENSDDPTDASIIYNELNPKSARNVGVAFIILAAVSGIYAIYIAGWIPVVFGAVGVAVLASYSFSKFPLSYLPVGEVISGFVMGGIIPLASYYVFTLQIEPMGDRVLHTNNHFYRSDNDDKQHIRYRKGS